MNWTSEMPTVEGFYPYRSASTKPTVIFITTRIVGNAAQLVAYFVKQSTPVLWVDLDGEFGPMIDLS